MTNRELKKRPAGKHDVVKIAYANFATNRQKSELKIEGKEFDNEALLEALGFEPNEGVMTLKTVANNEVERNANGEVIRRTQNGKVLTDKTAEKERE